MVVQEKKKKLEILSDSDGFCTLHELICYENMYEESVRLFFHLTLPILKICILLREIKELASHSQLPEKNGVCVRGK